MQDYKTLIYANLVFFFIVAAVSASGIFSTSAPPTPESLFAPLEVKEREKKGEKSPSQDPSDIKVERFIHGLIPTANLTPLKTSSTREFARIFTYRLTGTIVTESKSTSFAFFENKANGHQKTYKTGDVLDGAKIARISPSAVHFEYQGKKIKLPIKFGSQRGGKKWRKRGRRGRGRWRKGRNRQGGKGGGKKGKDGKKLSDEERRQRRLKRMVRWMEKNPDRFRRFAKMMKKRNPERYKERMEELKESNPEIYRKVVNLLKEK